MRYALVFSIPVFYTPAFQRPQPLFGLMTHTERDRRTDTLKTIPAFAIVAGNNQQQRKTPSGPSY